MLQQQFLVALVAVAGTSPALAGNGNENKHSRTPATYCLYDIGRLPGLPAGETSISVTAINNRNQVVGWIALAGGFSPTHPFIWDRVRGMRDLGSLPGHDNTTAEDINDAGVVIGGSADSDTGVDLAFIWTERDGIRELDMSLGGVESFASSINRRGQIAGAGELGTSGVVHAALRDINGDVLDLGAFPGGDGFSGASALNDRGQVVGASSGPFAPEAFIWDERRGLRHLIEPNSTLHTSPADINNRGEVVGEMLSTGLSRAFRWTERTGLEDLGTLSGVDTDFGIATGINRWGHIVGASQIATAGPVHAFVWSRKGAMQDLNERIDPTSPLASVAVLVIAHAINDAGWIVANGFIPDVADQQRSFVLIPHRHPGKRPCP